MDSNYVVIVIVIIFILIGLFSDGNDGPGGHLSV